MEAYGTDLRARVVAAHIVGDGSIRELAAQYCMVKNTVENWLRLLRETGNVAPRPHGGGVKATISGTVLQALRELVEKAPDATLEELHCALEKRCQIETSSSAVSRALLRENITRKRRRSTRVSRTVQT